MLKPLGPSKRGADGGAIDREDDDHHSSDWLRRQQFKGGSGEDDPFSLHLRACRAVGKESNHSKTTLLTSRFCPRGAGAQSSGPFPQLRDVDCPASHLSATPSRSPPVRLVSGRAHAQLDPDRE